MKRALVMPEKWAKASRCFGMWQEKLVREGQLAEAVAFAANCTARLLGNRMGRMREAKDMGTEGNADGNGVCGDSAGGI